MCLGLQSDLSLHSGFPTKIVLAFGFEAFTATKRIQRFGDCLYLHHQGRRRQRHAGLQVYSDTAGCRCVYNL